MACHFPIKGWLSRHKTESGKRPFTTVRDQALVDQPMEVPCGQCIGCRIGKAQDWATRLEAERYFHESSRFLTLTYDDRHMPEGCTLVPLDAKRFIERLRYWSYGHTGLPIRYFTGAEYGDSPMVPGSGFELGRPHYHIIGYSLAFPDEKAAEKSRTGEDQFSSEILDKLWGKGRCRVGMVTRESCGYVAGYAVKKMNGDRAESHYRQLDLRTGVVYPVHPEFVRCSNRPGIGRGFVEKFETDVYPADHVVQAGKVRHVPRYFDKVLEAVKPELLESVKEQRRKVAEARSDDNTPERRLVKAEVAFLKSRMFKRDGAG